MRSRVGTEKHGQGTTPSRKRARGEYGWVHEIKRQGEQCKSRGGEKGSCRLVERDYGGNASVLGLAPLPYRHVTMWRTADSVPI